MTNTERLKHFRRWQLLVKLAPKRYRINTQIVGKQWYASLQEYHRSNRYSESLYIQVELDTGKERCKSSYETGFCSVETLPAWQLEIEELSRPLPLLNAIQSR
jgi:hypothetical protein